MSMILFFTMFVSFMVVHLFTKHNKEQVPSYVLENTAHAEAGAREGGASVVAMKVPKERRYHQERSGLDRRRAERRSRLDRQSAA